MGDDGNTNFELPTLKRQTDNLSAGAMDLDRLFGDPAPEKAGPQRVTPAAIGITPPVPEVNVSRESEPAPFLALASEGDDASVSLDPPAFGDGDRNALPFDDAPLLRRARPARPWPFAAPRRRFRATALAPPARREWKRRSPLSRPPRP